jgi:uncharacterized protein YkwD
VAHSLLREAPSTIPSTIEVVMGLFSRLLDVLTRFLSGGGGGSPPTPNPPPAPPPEPDPVPEPEQPVWVAELLRLHNEERRRQGAVALRTDARLMAAAQGHADWMAETGRHQHQPGRNGSTPASRASDAGYPWRTVGENIAYGFISAASVF